MSLASYHYHRLATRKNQIRAQIHCHMEKKRNPVGPHPFSSQAATPTQKATAVSDALHVY